VRGRCTQRRGALRDGARPHRAAAAGAAGRLGCGGDRQRHGVRAPGGRVTAEEIEQVRAALSAAPGWRGYRIHARGPEIRRPRAVRRLRHGIGRADSRRDGMRALRGAAGAESPSVALQPRAALRPSATRTRGPSPHTAGASAAASTAGWGWATGAPWRMSSPSTYRIWARNLSTNCPATRCSAAGGDARGARAPPVRAGPTVAPVGIAPARRRDAEQKAPAHHGPTGPGAGIVRGRARHRPGARRLDAPDIESTRWIVRQLRRHLDRSRRAGPRRWLHPGGLPPRRIPLRAPRPPGRCIWRCVACRRSSA